MLAPPEPARVDALLDDVEAFFGSGTGDALLLSAWPTPDLRPRGWRLQGHPPLLIRPPAERLGFLPLFRFTLWTRSRSGAGPVPTTRSAR